VSGPAVELRGLRKVYGPITAVDDVTLTVQTGDVYGYLGPNGAGKTTSLRMMLGLIRPSGGDVRLFGRDPMADPVAALDGVAGFVEEPAFYPYLSGRANLELLAALDGGAGSERISRALDLVDLGGRAGDRVRAYSQGMRQRLGIAAALIRDPRLLHQGRISYEGSLDALVQQAGAGFTLEPTDVARALELCRAAEGVHDVQAHNGAIRFEGDTEAVAALTVVLGRQGIGIRSLVPSRVSLKQLFFDLTESGGP
jgi:ABC-2 type transport system ATP-binding protein